MKKTKIYIIVISLILLLILNIIAILPFAIALIIYLKSKDLNKVLKFLTLFSLVGLIIVGGFLAVCGGIFLFDSRGNGIAPFALAGGIVLFVLGIFFMTKVLKKKESKLEVKKEQIEL